MRRRTVALVLATVLAPPSAAVTRAEAPTASVSEPGSLPQTTSPSTPAAAPAEPQTREPWLTLRKAQLLGAAAGLALGVTFAQQPDAPITALRRLRGIDAILTGSA